MNCNTFSCENEELLSSIVERLRHFEVNSLTYPDSKGVYWALCPFHNGKNNHSFSFSKEGYYCDICKNRGSISDLGRKLGTLPLSYDPMMSIDGVTLEQYASAYKLPLEFLKSLDITERKKAKVRRISIPYFDFSGNELGARIILSLNGSANPIWKSKSHIAPYGLWKINKLLHDCRINREPFNKIILVEEEVDAQILWFFGYPALAIPEDVKWKSVWKNYLEDQELFVWQAPDLDGKKFLHRIQKDFTDFMIIQAPDDWKSISYCHDAGIDISVHLLNLLESAIPFSVILERDKRQEIEKLYEQAIPLMQSDVLEEVYHQCKMLGVVEEERTIKLLYLILTSRVFDTPVSTAIKGTSSVGKSYVVKMVLKLFPPSAFFEVTSMSEKALYYLEESLVHRYLILFEAAGLTSDFIYYTVRTLLSEGQLKHITVTNDERGLHDLVLEKEGPTGFITTTTKINLDPELSTRMLSIDGNDDPNQTKAIMLRLAEEFMGEMTTHRVPERFQAFQLWIQEVGIHKVVIPFAEVIAENTKCEAVRLRRDFKTVLILIKSSVVLYQKQREVDEHGFIIAKIEDYRIVYDLIHDLINQGSEKSVKPKIRETVEAVKKLLGTNNDLFHSVLTEDYHSTNKCIDNETLAKELGRDTSSTSRRVAEAIELGYLKNLNTVRGKRSEITLGKPLPDDEFVLPPPDLVEKIWGDLLKTCAIVQHSIQIEGA